VEVFWATLELLCPYNTTRSKKKKKTWAIKISLNMTQDVNIKNDELLVYTYNVRAIAIISTKNQNKPQFRTQ
jgi:hypothetical protein